MRSLMAGIGLTLGLVSPWPGGAVQGPTCYTDTDTTAQYVTFVTGIVTWGDSASLVGQGIPFKPAQGVTAVTDTSVCRSALNAYNALYPPADSAKHVGRVSVMHVGTSALAIIGIRGPASPRPVVIFMDSTFQHLASMAGL